MSGLHTIRPFTSIDDYHECVALQEDTWGHGFSERVAPAILKVSQILGGVAAGAYDDQGSLDGFVFGMTGVRDGEIVHWSDMLAVRPGIRDGGLGRKLKSYQRMRVMELGVRKMFWTFDPLQSRNAYLNFNKLGIVVREYVTDMYGQTDSPLHRGVGTDRFVALWLLDSDRVRDRLEGWGGGVAGTGPAIDSAEGPLDVGDLTVALEARLGDGHPSPGAPDLSLEDDLIAVNVPTDIVSLMEGDLELARSWRMATRATFMHYLAEGYEVCDFFRGGSASTYVVARGDHREVP